MNPKTKQDPRIGRTIKLLGDALRELIVERGYDVLTVQDITDRANVSRTTFYLHFKDKDELLFATIRQVYDSISGQFHHQLQQIHSLEELESVACDTADFDHVAENADFYRIMLGKHGSAAFIQVILNYLTTEMQETLLKPLMDGTPNPFMPMDFVASFLAGAEIGIMNWWLQNNLHYPAEKMAKMQYALSVGGLMAVLGMMNESANETAKDPVGETDAT